MPNYKFSYVIDPAACMTCATCEVECEDGAIYIEDYYTFAIDDQKCTRCASCYKACPSNAISRQNIAKAS